jgi:hypothetical protein
MNMNGFEKGVEEIRMPEISIEREEGLERFVRLSPSQQKEILEVADGDEEAAFWSGLTFGHPEKEQELIEQFKKYKPHIADPENLVRKINHFLRENSGYAPEEVGNPVADPQERVRKLFSYFRPREMPERIIVVPSDNLTAPTSGRSWLLGSDGYVVSHSTNPDNFDHETLHLIINPMVEKFENILSEEQKKSILEMGAEKLQEKYGDDWMPMFCEEIINTYKECVEKGESPETLEGFQQKIQFISDEDFAEVLRSEGKGSEIRQLGIKTKEELSDRAKEYYSRYVENNLRDVIYRIYMAYGDSDDGFEAAFKRGISEI